MSSTYFKIPYTDGTDLQTYKTRWLYVHEHHTSGVTTIVNDRGKTLMMFCDDADDDKALVAALTHKGEHYDKRESWDGDVAKLR